MMPSRLKTIKPTIGRIRPLLATPRQIRDTRYSPDATVRGWYKSKRWQDLRLEVLMRDGFICQRSGELCAGKGQAPNAPVANHIIPHRGNPALFWDKNNIETVTKAVHDSIIQAEERRSLN